MTEQVTGLGRCGKALTVLTTHDIEDQIEEIKQKGNLVGSWALRTQMR